MCSSPALPTPKGISEGLTCMPPPGAGKENIITITWIVRKYVVMQTYTLMYTVHLHVHVTVHFTTPYK